MPKAVPTAAERLVRNCARAALYLSLVATGVALKLLLLLAHPPVPPEMRHIEELQKMWSGVDFLALPEVRMLRDYIAIDTSEPDANEIPGAEFLAAHLAPPVSSRTSNGWPTGTPTSGRSSRARTPRRSCSRVTSTSSRRRVRGLGLPAVRRRDRRPVDVRPRHL